MKLAWLAVVAAGAVTVAAQTSAPPADAVFDAASIKLNRDGGPLAGMRRSPGGRFEATNTQLSSLISFAYQLQSFELDGGPPWLMNDRWDIVAKIAGDPPPAPPGTADAIMIATRALLAERFKLAVHRETREVVSACARGSRRAPGHRAAAFDGGLPRDSARDRPGDERWPHPRPIRTRQTASCAACGSASGGSSSAGGR